ncbi:MAG: hypothetical protein EHM33_19160 [Chloroflexi bacterium]|nr:MAG: hypothetical protein EHM33_19160 [Chloroflexota bacterium]
MKSDAMMKRAFASLVTVKGELEVAVSEALDVSELAEDLFTKKPDIVFLSETTPLAQNDSLLQLLIRYPGLKVVVVSNDSNWLHIFKHENKLLISIDDLLPIINSS